MIGAKLPETVLLQLEMSKGANDKWTLSTLRNKLNDYIMARMRAEKRYNSVENKTRPCIGGAKRTCVGNNKDTNGIIPTFEHRGHVPGFVPRGPTPRRSVYDEKSRVTSGEALVANNVGKQHHTNTVNKDYSTFCRYCKNGHWSDECPTYRSIEDREKMLKDSCYICLKIGHTSTKCKRGKLCAYCGDRNSHHRSLCPTKFKFQTLVHIY